MGRWMENSVLLCIAVCGVCIHIYEPYVHYLESARKILRTQLKNRNGCLGKYAIDTLDLSMMKKTAADS